MRTEEPLFVPILTLFYGYISLTDLSIQSHQEFLKEYEEYAHLNE